MHTISKFLILLCLFVSCGRAYALDQMTTWGAANPSLYNSATQSLQVVKGIGDDNLYILEADPVTGGIPVSFAETIKTISYKDRHDYSSVNVTTAAYTEIVASTGAVINKLYIFDSSGETLYLATGAAASEVDLLMITPGGNGDIIVNIAAGTRLSIKAISADAISGELVVNATN